jgi:hypothetical protein
VQEGGFIALCAAFGIGSPIAIALSLVKRIPDFLCGAPGLWLWRRMEGDDLLRFFTRRKLPRNLTGDFASGEPNGL